MKRLAFVVGMGAVALSASAVEAKRRVPARLDCDNCSVCHQITFDVHGTDNKPVPNMQVKVGVVPSYNAGGIIWLGNPIALPKPQPLDLCINDPPNTVLAVVYEFTSTLGSPFVYIRLRRAPPAGNDSISIEIKTAKPERT